MYMKIKQFSSIRRLEGETPQEAKTIPALSFRSI